jgi:hypothetical protein
MLLRLLNKPSTSTYIYVGIVLTIGYRLDNHGSVPDGWNIFLCPKRQAVDHSLQSPPPFPPRIKWSECVGDHMPSVSFLGYKCTFLHAFIKNCGFYVLRLQSIFIAVVACFNAVLCLNYCFIMKPQVLWELFWLWQKIKDELNTCSAGSFWSCVNVLQVYVKFSIPYMNEYSLI